MKTELLSCSFGCVEVSKVVSSDLFRLCILLVVARVVFVDGEFSKMDSYIRDLFWDDVVGTVVV